MASVDFRSGGFDGAYRRRVGDYGHDSAHPDDGLVDGAPVAGLAGRIGRLLNYMGAVVSVALMIGLAGWGYRLVVRDVSGVPVIRAMSGESRVAPENPGGELSAHTGLAVNAVPGGAVGVQPGDRVAIAPAATGLADEDAPMGSFGATEAIPGALSESPLADEALDPVIAMQDSELAAQRAEAERVAAETAALAHAAEAEAAAALTADAPAAEAAVNEAVTGLDGAPVDAAAISAALAEANATIQEPVDAVAPPPPGALAASARPAQRPARVTRTAAAVAPAAAAPAATPAVARASDAPAARPAVAAAAPEPVRQVSASAGGTVAQIGAFDSEAVARSEWDRISARAGGLFAGKGQIIQRHEANGRVFYRLRVAGFDSRAQANEFCNALKARGTDCIPLAN